MKAYVVGGAVRDELLGLPVADRDWVVVGATPGEMAAQGYKPVGRDFPVFLHPVTHEEYALARTERKSGHGYRGFTIHASPDVTLEEDLGRRDLTINAMARDASGALVDPFGGEKDLRAGVLRHVGAAFTEDPVRILRVARFAARFRFRVADETLQLLRRMVADGEADHLVPERAWQEFARGLCEAHPAAMLEVLQQCGLLERLFPGLALDAALLEALARAAAAASPVTTRFTVLGWRLDAAALGDIAARLRLPNDVRELALHAVRHAHALREAHAAPPVALLAELKAVDAFRRRDRFLELLRAARLAEPTDALQRGADRLALALEAAGRVDAGAIAAGAATPSEIPGRIDRAREAAIADALAAQAGR